MDKIAQFVQKSNCNATTVAVFGAIGAAVVAFKALSFFKVLVDVFFRSGVNLKKYGAGRGGWAVITGASDGIGKEFAYQLASKKMNIVLVSRTESKLKALAQEIEEKYSVQTKIFAMDFAKGDDKDYQSLKTLLTPVEVTVLVNNVGTNHEIPTPFEEESDKIVKDIVEININAAMKMTKIIVPGMVSRKNGLIINLGSFAGLVPTPYLSVYSGSKAFLSSWSQAIGAELAPKGVVVQNVNTYFVVSAMSKIRRATMLIPMPKPYVRSVLGQIGVSGGASTPYTSTPFYSHAIANWLIDNVFNRAFWVNQNYNIQVDIRKRALRKREREAAAAAKNQ
ncbi:17beta-estradiol 17-dehydrogenase / very-long-chain 3-oxoacyl-CoA reductase [Entomortierella parvispora]|uniref:Very-long-chain 3-oxoacyl-CoA reductase n=1 Tax=Entomortierella parvispora TaxID=205924 RepID=A0A9P3H947_9FUNG|nr:17beta-estradiol 17-dehydrogenase / very-long-chain 3-oxoacyl-CoA reductase [Entomortierella parvispora]